jgi:hypothetical protein
MVRSHQSAAGCSGLEEMERRHQNESVAQLCEALLQGRCCTHGRPPAPLERRASRKRCSTCEADQTLNVRPPQVRFASSLRRQRRMKSSPFQTDHRGYIISPSPDETSTYSNLQPCPVGALFRVKSAGMHSVLLNDLIEWINLPSDIAAQLHEWPAAGAHAIRAWRRTSLSPSIVLPW